MVPLLLSCITLEFFTFNNGFIAFFAWAKDGGTREGPDNGGGGSKGGIVGTFSVDCKVVCFY